MKPITRNFTIVATLVGLAACGATVSQLATDATTISGAFVNIIAPLASVSGISAKTSSTITTDLQKINTAAANIAASATPGASDAGSFISAVEDLAPTVLGMAGVSPAVSDLVYATEALLPEFEAVAGMVAAPLPAGKPLPTTTAARATIAKYAHK